MHGLPSFLIMMLLLPPVPAFIIRLCVSWRSYVVGAAVGTITVVFFVILSLEIVMNDPALLQVYAMALFPAVIAGTVGSGLAKLAMEAAYSGES